MISASQFDIILGQDSNYEDLLQMGNIGMIHAAAGTGKTTLMLNLLSVLGSRYDTKYFSFEESTDRLQKNVTRLLINPNNVAVSGINTEDELFEQVRSKHKEVIVIDSINMIMRTDSRTLNDLWNRLTKLARGHNKLVIVINQRTTTGSPKGGTHGVHIVDFVMTMDRSILCKNEIIYKLIKNRFGDTGNCLLKMTDRGLVFDSVITYDEKDQKKEVTECKRVIKKFFKDNYKKYNFKKLCSVAGFSDKVVTVTLQQLCDDNVLQVHKGNTYMSTQKRSFGEKVSLLTKLIKKL